MDFRIAWHYGPLIDFRQRELRPPIYILSLSFSSSSFSFTVSLLFHSHERRIHNVFDQYSKDVLWYQKELTHISPACRELLENYSRIPPAEVNSHVFELVRLKTLIFL